MKRVCVFAGSSLGAASEYTTAARHLGQVLAGRGLGLVYGGASVGLMGAVADAVLEAGGHVTGVIPDALVAREIAHLGVSELRIVSSMHARKLLMSELADAFVALPGGLGTLEELFEVLTWAQLGLHRKPCGLLDVNGYFEGLLAFIDHAVEERFVRREYRQMLAVSTSADALLETIGRHAPPAVEIWIDRSST